MRTYIDFTSYSAWRPLRAWRENLLARPKSSDRFDELNANGIGEEEEERRARINGCHSHDKHKMTLSPTSRTCMPPHVGRD